MNLIIALTILSLGNFSQDTSFNRQYHGNWGRTTWVYDFYIDNTFEFTTSGHFGNTKSKGTYYIKDDNLFLTRDSGRAMEMNKRLIMEGDSIIIDYQLGYDYKVTNLSSDEEFLFLDYSSKKRVFKYPQVAADNIKEKEDLEEVLNMAFNSKEMRQYYHFDSLPERRLLVTNYYELDAIIKVDSMTAIFQPESNIKNLFYVKIDNINQNLNDIRIELSIKDEGAKIWFYFRKKDGKWEYSKPNVFEW